jgi:hypothetical protein
MPRIVPSQVIDFIDRTFPLISRDNQDASQNLALSPEVRGALLGLVDLVIRIPEHLIVDNAALGDIVLSVETIRSSVREAEAISLAEKQLHGWTVLKPAAHPGRGIPTGGWNPAIIIRRALARCHDDAPSVSSDELAFVRDSELRDLVERDVSAVRSALANGEWKAATVLGGSVVEALLLSFVLHIEPREVSDALARAVANGWLKQKPKGDPREWHIADYIEVAFELKALSETTAHQARLLRGFRNLIHPGLEMRKTQSCSAGTAHAARAAIEMVTEDLRRSWRD